MDAYVLQSGNIYGTRSGYSTTATLAPEGEEAIYSKKAMLTLGITRPHIRDVYSSKPAIKVGITNHV